MSIILANEYTPISTACYGWQKKPKPKPVIKKELVKKNQKSTWAREGLGNKDIYSGDLLAMMHEETDKDLQRQRFPDQDDFKQKEKRQGKRLLSTDFVKKVLTLNRNLLFEKSLGVKGSGAFYLVVNGKDGKPEKTYTGACFRLGWIPEWTTMETDTADLVYQDGLTYGWRTVLQRLVQKRAITMRQVNEVFGRVYAQDLRGKNWALNTQAFQ